MRSGSCRPPSTVYMICRSSGSPATARSSQLRQHLGLVGVPGGDAATRGSVPRRAASRSGSPSCARRRSPPAATSWARRRCRRSRSWVSSRRVSRERRTTSACGTSSWQRAASRSSSREGRLDAVVVPDRAGTCAVRRDPGRREHQLVAGLDTSNSSTVRVRRLATGRRGPAQDELVGPGHGDDRLLAVGVAPAHPRPDRAVVDAHDPLVTHPDGALDAGDPAHQVGATVAGGHHVEEHDLAGRRW